MPTNERFNSLSHFAGLCLACIGAPLLWQKGSAIEGSLTTACLATFGVTLILMYAASCGFHSHRGRHQDRWAKADHCAIYLLIAGTYTPLALLGLPGGWGWLLFGCVWAVALFGIFRELKSAAGQAPDVRLYLALGWVGLLAAAPLYESLSSAAVQTLLLGAGLYSLGIPFYRRSGDWPHAHGVWHLFVLAGSTAHFMTVLNLPG